jgi:hypothetical protein
MRTAVVTAARGVFPADLVTTALVDVGINATAVAADLVRTTFILRAA